MQVPTVGSLVAATLCVIFITQFKDTSAAVVRRLYDPTLTMAVLGDVERLIGHSSELQKRKVDFGYSGRYGAANSVGSKLLALKNAANWNNPGRKRRDAEGQNLVENEPEVALAVLHELMAYIEPESTNYQKRRADLGYGSRFRAASSIGSKLMALKTAADWNSPGRRKRELDQDIDEQYLRRPSYFFNPKLALAVLDEIKDLSLHRQNLLKRGGADVGYYGRYDAASSVGSKLLAMKQAADSAGPGKRAIKED